ncbi:MAG: transposase, partial [Rickettsia endosymbiont of Stiretrus anchorago]|nr:transposase [Rickettsia endosymbiont of Stiretrus anchorago]
TNIRKDMKNYLLELKDKTMLRKRSLIESVFNILKNRMNLEHTRHRSPVNFLVHILACVTAYAITKSHAKLDVLAPEKLLLS